MKNILTILVSVAIILSLASSCKKEKMPDSLPPITTEGKGTFGCKINGEIWIPKTQDEFLGNNFNLYSIYEEDLPKRISVVASKIYDDFKQEFAIFIYEPITMGVLDTNIINMRYADVNISIESYKNHKYKQFTNFIITRYDKTNRIVSGTFEGLLVKSITKDSIRITEGRFDVRF
ncbi:MAG: hypothetical protein IPO14_00745 [Saprospiraceae bacterium]|jgi:hypothetical protein|nr:hypothetical protein [Saprospiraceae bacterium]